MWLRRELTDQYDAFNYKFYLSYMLVNFLALFCIIKAYCITKGSNYRLNKDVRKIILRRQAIYFLILLFLESVLIFKTISTWYDAVPKKGFFNTLLLDTAFLYVSRGIIIPLLRLLEPGFVQQLKQLGQSCCEKICQRSDRESTSRSSLVSREKQNQQEFDPNIVFLSSS